MPIGPYAEDAMARTESAVRDFCKEAAVERMEWKTERVLCEVQVARFCDGRKWSLSVRLVANSLEEIVGFRVDRSHTRSLATETRPFRGRRVPGSAIVEFGLSLIDFSNHTYRNRMLSTDKKLGFARPERPAPRQATADG